MGEGERKELREKLQRLLNAAVGQYAPSGKSGTSTGMCVAVQEGCIIICNGNGITPLQKARKRRGGATISWTAALPTSC